MDATITLRDGTSVPIRPLAESDLDRLHAFFTAMPEEDRVFLRLDVADREQLERRIHEMRDGQVFRLVAVIDDEIAAYGILEREGHTWKSHIGELRLFVAPDRQRQGLGMHMARQLYLLAVSERIEELVVRMMRPQKAARSIFRRLGFHKETVLPDYVKDRKGRLQDLVLMRCELQVLLKEMEDYFADRDMQLHR